MDNIGPWIAGTVALVVTLLAGVWQTAAARAASKPAQLSALTDGYGNLFDDLHAEIGRLYAEIKASRDAEQECQMVMSNLRLRVSLLESKLKEHPE